MVSLCIYLSVFSKKQAQTCTENGKRSERHAQYCKVPKELRDDRADADSMLLQATFLIAAGFSHTALRRPCANAACQLPQHRAAVCAAAAAENNDERARLESLWALPSENKYESELRSTGGDVWASKDLRSFADGKLVVRKHAKGQLPPGSKADPTESLLAEQFLVEWEHLVDGECDDHFQPGFTKVTADMLLSREPPLPGGSTRGDVWAANDVMLGMGGNISERHCCGEEAHQRLSSRPIEK